jgi:hypothetical protein
MELPDKIRVSGFIQLGGDYKAEKRQDKIEPGPSLKQQDILVTSYAQVRETGQPGNCGGQRLGPAFVRPCMAMLRREGSNPEGTARLLGCAPCV